MSSLRHCVKFQNMPVIYGGSCPTPKLEDHPLSAVCDCLFNLESKINKKKIWQRNHRKAGIEWTPKSHVYQKHFKQWSVPNITGVSIEPFSQTFIKNRIFLLAAMIQNRTLCVLCVSLLINILHISSNTTWPLHLVHCD
jgi:hypothetical protein